jgi:hypothetical protein
MHAIRVDESGWSIYQGINCLVSDKDCVTGGFGQLLDAGSRTMVVAISPAAWAARTTCSKFALVST